MQITINLTDPQATSIALDEVIFAQSVVEINLSTIPATETIADGTSLALLTPQGKAMAIAQVASNVATLNTNTIECYEFVRDLPVEAARDAYIVLGSATKPIAIVPVQVARNVMTVTPPTEYAPIYPTAVQLQEILAEMDAKRADVNALVAQATQSIAQSTETATQAASDAAKAQEGAEGAQKGAEAAQEAAETALNNGCVYKVVDLGSSSIIGLQRVNTIYKIAPIGLSSIDFSPPSLTAEEVIVFWLWIVMGETAHQLGFPSTVTWLSEGAFAANTETLLAFMSTDGGATWQANLQWEKAVTA